MKANNIYNQEKLTTDTFMFCICRLSYIFTLYQNWFLRHLFCFHDSYSVAFRGQQKEEDYKKISVTNAMRNIFILRQKKIQHLVKKIFILKFFLFYHIKTAQKCTFYWCRVQLM